MTRSNRRVLLAVALAAAAMPSAAAELVANGGFETGDLAPWFTAVPGNPGLCALGWNVSDVGGGEATSCQPGVYGGTFPGPPFLGSFAAYNSFDAGGMLEYDLVQQITLPEVFDIAVLSWVHTYNVDLTENATMLREFRIELRNPDTGLAHVVLHQEQIGVLDQQVETDWTTHQLDVRAPLGKYAGMDVQIAFVNRVTESSTGPGGFGLDEASLWLDVVPIFADGFDATP